MSEPNKCANYIFKGFIFILTLVPIITITTILFIFCVIYDSFILVYFALIGWICELDISNCHGSFLVDGLKYPWKLLITFYEKLYKFFNELLLIKE